jgi:kynurenine formamidase
MGLLPSLLSGLSSGSIEAIDLTAPLSPATPVLRLPPPFANTVHLSLEPVSDFDDAGPMWRWHNIHTGEHTGTHLDAPAHWATGRNGSTVDRIGLDRLIGPAAVVDVTEQVADDNDFLLEPHHLLAWEAEHGRVPEGAWVLLRSGWSARATDEAAFSTRTRTGRTPPDRRRQPLAGSRQNGRSPGSGWRPWASTRVARAAWIPRSPPTTSCSGPTATD